MKMLFCFIAMLTLSIAVRAEKLYPGKLVFANGKILTGLVSLPKGPTDKDVAFKANEDDDKVKYKSEELKTIVYYFAKDSVMYDRLKTYNITHKKITQPVWLKVMIRGYVTLYYALKEGNMVLSNGGLELDDQYWLCLRPNEEAATIVSWKYGYNANSTFIRRGPEYFEDYPELVKKIETKEYKWNNIMQVVKEYNDWKTRKKTK